MLFIWSATRTYTSIGWQMGRSMEREVPLDEDHERAADTITRRVLEG